MSFQPQAPLTSQPPPPPFAPASPSAPPAKGKRRKGMIVLGLVVLIVGLVAGGAVVGKAMSNYEDAVRSLARAPVGCTTTLVFDEPATFIIYIETKGELGELGGDCGASSGPYEHPGDKLPRVSLTLEDPNGDPVDLERGVTASYDVAGFVGTAVRTVVIEQAGTYHLNVESDDSDFAMAIGKNPREDSDKLAVIGAAIALVGFIVGLLLFLLGLRRRRPDPTITDVRNPLGPLPGWPPGPYAGAAPTVPQVPGQPPVRPPDHPGGGFAPPTFAPPSAPASSGGTPPVVAPPEAPAPGPPTVAVPTLPPVGSPPVAAPTVTRPTVTPPTAAPPTIDPQPVTPPLVTPQDEPSGTGWAIPVDDEEQPGA